MSSRVTNVEQSPRDPTTILIVDDEPGIREALSTMLRQTGYRVCSAASGREGLERVRQHRPDLVLLDVVMPGLDGLQVCRQIKADPALAGIHVLLMSGLATGPEDEVGGRESGADDYLVKPFTTALMLARVRTFERIQKAEAALRELNLQLEQKVAERTVALETTNRRLAEEVAERNRAEAELKVLGAALKATANAVMITDPQAVIQWANPAFASLTGYHIEEAIGRTPAELFKSSLHSAEFYDELWATINSGRSWQREVVNRRKDGTLYHEDLTITPIVDAAGRIQHFVAVKQDITERKQAQEALQALPRRILEAQEAERQRVARELHDGVGQLIASVRFRLRGLEAKLSAAGLANLSQDAGQAQTYLERAMEEIRRVARNLRPGELDDLGFLAAIQSACADFSDRTGIPVNLESLRLPNRLPAEMELAVYRIVQEALANVERHARAASVTIRMVQLGRELLLSVCDDGRGFAARQALAARVGLGLANMRERAAHLGGSVRITSQAGAGTEISIRLPLNRTSPTTANEAETKPHSCPAGG